MNRLIEQTMDSKTFLEETIKEFKNVVKVEDGGFIYDITKDGTYMINMSGAVTYDFVKPQNDKRYVLLKTGFHTVDIVEYKEEINISVVKEFYKNAKSIKLQGGQTFEIPQKHRYFKDTDENCIFLIHNENERNGSKGFVLLKSESYQSEILEYKEELNTPKHYDNTKGTLYKVAQERGWNTYLFDIVKRLERAEKKGEFNQDLEKSINVIKLWLNEN